jgi:DNA repair protein SbcD/Mre11
MKRRSLRLLHTSDVHIDGYGVGLRDAPHADVCLCPLHGIERLAEEHRVDGVLVVGDLFDHARIGEQAMEGVYGLLDRLPGECVVMVGNHDVHDDRSLYHRHRHVVDSSGVVLIDEHAGAEIRMLGDAVHLWGRAMDEHSPAFRPLAGAAEHPGDAWYLVLGHGHYVDDPVNSHRSSLITPEDIASTGADYVGLGHWHVTTDVSQPDVTAWYSGAPSGTPGGRALILDLDPEHGVRVTPVDVPLDPAGCAHR